MGEVRPEPHFERRSALERQRRSAVDLEPVRHRRERQHADQAPQPTSRRTILRAGLRPAVDQSFEMPQGGPRINATPRP